MRVRKPSILTFDPLRLLGVPNAPWIAAPTTLVLVAIASGLRLLISLYEPRSLIFATFYPALAIATMMFGRLWGYFAVITSLGVSMYAFMEPFFHLDLTSKTSLVNLALYFVCGSILVEICTGYRKALERIQAKRELLAQEHSRTELLARELQHRSKNTAAVIASIVRQSLKGDNEATNRILGRINAMYAADLLDRTPKGLCDLGQLIAQELSSIEQHRVSISGPAVQVAYDLARSLAMILHELLTNAAKYGALSTAGGMITVTWTKQGSSVHLSWEETGGPLLSGPPQRLGFGTFLIERLLSEHGGTLQQTFGSRGHLSRMSFEVAASAKSDQAA